MTPFARLVRLPLAAARKVVCTGVRSFAIADAERSQRCYLEAPTDHCYGDGGRTDGSTAAGKTPMLLGASLAILGFFDKGEELKKDPPVVMKIKRSILYIQVHSSRQDLYIYPCSRYFDLISTDVKNDKDCLAFT